MSVDKLRKQIEALAREHPLQYLFSSVVLTNQGRVAAQRGALLGGTGEEAEAALHAEMFKHLQMHHLLMGQALVEPARTRIVAEHNPRESDLRLLLAQSPFVPEGREALFARGLWAGLHGDFIVASHVLIPQIEHSIRHLLAAAGAIPSTLRSDGVQDELDLNSTLFMPELKAVFSDDLIFDLRGLLVERFGSNLRNRFAHGLMDQQEFLSYTSAYLWWVSLFLCICPLIRTRSEQSESPGPEEGTDGADPGEGDVAEALGCNTSPSTAWTPRRTSALPGLRELMRKHHVCTP